MKQTLPKFSSARTSAFLSAYTVRASPCVASQHVITLVFVRPDRVQGGIQLNEL